LAENEFLAADVQPDHVELPYCSVKSQPKNALQSRGLLLSTSFSDVSEELRRSSLMSFVRASGNHWNQGYGERVGYRDEDVYQNQDKYVQNLPSWPPLNTFPLEATKHPLTGGLGPEPMPKCGKLSSY
jgi:hypothetical protein